MFRDELDMLHCRLEELDGAVDRFVLTEAPVTHQGDPKPLHYMENRKRFAPWKDKITHVIATPPSRAEAPDMGPWQREHFQRDAALGPMRRAGLAPQDRVLISDVDEIPSRAVLDAEPDSGATAMMRLAMYAVDWLYPEPHPCLVAARALVIERHGGLAATRDARGSFRAIPDGGWHLTWLGGVEAQRAKLGVHCHLEMTAEMRERISSGACYRDGTHVSGIAMVPADVDGTWPRMIRERRCPPEWFRPRGETGASS